MQVAKKFGRRQKHSFKNEKGRQTATTATEAKGPLIPAGTKGLRYIARIGGEKPRDGNSNEWFFCVYEEGDVWVIAGYVYSELAQNLTLATKNTEGKISVTTDIAATTNVTPNEEKPLEMSRGVKWILITLLTLPTLLVFLLLIKKPRQNQKRDKNFLPNTAEFAEEIDTKNSKQSPNSTRISTKKHPKKFTTNEKYFCKIEENQPKNTKNATKNSENRKNNSDFVSKFFTTKLPTYPDDDDLL